MGYVMDEVKYQVFVSSTYTDLKEERRQIVDMLLMYDCIPAAMEHFVAVDEEQFEVIKKIIDLCDYYILLIGRMYGSISPVTGKSYTEMEFDYAVEQGIPVLVFALDEHAVVNPEKEEKDVISAGKLAEFRDRAMTGRLVCTWQNEEELLKKIGPSLAKAFKSYDRPGWYRGDVRFVADDGLISKNTSGSEADATKNDNDSDDRLKSEFYGKTVNMIFTESLRFSSLYSGNETEPQHKCVKVRLDEMFAHISINMMTSITEDRFIDLINKTEKGYRVERDNAMRLLLFYINLGLMKNNTNSGDSYSISLTLLGISVRDEMNQFDKYNFSNYKLGRTVDD